MWLTQSLRDSIHVYVGITKSSATEYCSKCCDRFLNSWCWGQRRRSWLLDGSIESMPWLSVDEKGSRDREESWDLSSEGSLGQMHSKTPCLSEKKLDWESCVCICWLWQSKCCGTQHTTQGYGWLGRINFKQFTAGMRKEKENLQSRGLITQCRKISAFGVPRKYPPGQAASPAGYQPALSLAKPSFRVRNASRGMLLDARR